MYGLYIDTSCRLVLGILQVSDSSETTWVDYESYAEKKSSAVIHKLIDDLLKKNQIPMEKIALLLETAGPGSYTGMRISHGIAEVFKLFGKAKLSFHHFEVPAFLGISSGVWVASAFKGEFFVYRWYEDGKSETALLDATSFKQFCLELQCKKIPIYTHFKTELEHDFLNEVSSSFMETSVLIKQDLLHLMEKVFKDQNSSRKRPYYYRPLEKEFRLYENEA
ncbi:MAG: hypothetical protein HQK50_02350 [Oligoflexia bacterium]|nr:hypothetical protein [Oligoflexia bacterium]MBF0364380.1 hypothetical protein [Oligoflexia bacterium]